MDVAPLASGDDVDEGNVIGDELATAVDTCTSERAVKDMTGTHQRLRIKYTVSKPAGPDLPPGASAF